MAKIEWVKIRVLGEIFVKGIRRRIVIFDETNRTL